MTKYSDSLNREYIHLGECSGSTTVSGDDYIMLESPFRPLGGTFCATCQSVVALDQVAWADTGERISEYRKIIHDSVPSIFERWRLMLLASAYEGALRLDIDKDGNEGRAGFKAATSTKPLGAAQKVSKTYESSDDGIIVTGSLQSNLATSANLMSELSAALIQYTPEKFSVIICEIKKGLEGKQDALFYNISCPQHPEDGTTQVNASVHTAATKLMQHLARERGSFPGFIVTLELQSDGNWRNNIKLIEPD